MNMRKSILLFVSLFIFGTISVFSQSSNEPVIVDDAFIGHHYYHGDVQIKTVSKMKAIVAKDQLALEEVKKAVAPEVLAYFFACSGGFVAGWQIGNLPFGKFNPYLFAGGIGLAAVGLGFSAIVDRHLIKGVNIYNSNIKAVSYRDDIKFEFGFVPGGIGLTCYF